MRWSMAARDRESWATQAAIIAMAVLVAAVGFCVFDSHGGIDHHASPDLCLGVLAVLLPTVLAGGLPLTGLTSAYRLAPVADFSPHVPAPPPKLLS